MPPASIIYEGNRFWINSDGYIITNSEGSIVRSPNFTEKPLIFEISSGIDIVRCVTRFAQRYDVSVIVLCGNGLISDVEYKYPNSANPPVHISGIYQMLSFSGTYKRSGAAGGEAESYLTASLMDVVGEYMGGLVASSMKAASDVMLVTSITK